jgi:hypothetical protein
MPLHLCIVLHSRKHVCQAGKINNPDNYSAEFSSITDLMGKTQGGQPVNRGGRPFAERSRWRIRRQ